MANVSRISALFFVLTEVKKELVSFQTDDFEKKRVKGTPKIREKVKINRVDCEKKQIKKTIYKSSADDCRFFVLLLLYPDLRLFLFSVWCRVSTEAVTIRTILEEEIHVLQLRVAYYTCRSREISSAIQCFFLAKPVKRSSFFYLSS